MKLLPFLLMASIITVATTSASAERFDIEFHTGPSSFAGFVAKLPKKSISPKDSEEDVFFKLGEPWKRLTHGCVYRDVTVRSNLQGQMRPDTLVIDFVDHRISRIRVMPNRTFIRLIADGKLWVVPGSDLAEVGF